MIDLKIELSKLNIVKRIEQTLQEESFLKVSTRNDLGVGRDGKVPCKCGVYFIYRQKALTFDDDSWTLQYIGVHKSVRQRLSEHLFYTPDSKTNHKAYQINKQSEYMYAVKYILIEPCSLREYIERILIEQMDPPDNNHD
ncbi:hypothetical protein [Paenibacillus sp. FSL H8-0283]|uniref:hypothetical protein n=1 Tax=Paenibacillus sp. FSL H8-0283 TaxID=2921383 RepID=UPI00324B656C